MEENKPINKDILKKTNFIGKVIYTILSIIIISFIITLFLEYGHYITELADSIIDLGSNWIGSLPHFFRTFFRVLGISLVTCFMLGFLIIIVNIDRF